jgi:hypothetical protein
MPNPLFPFTWQYNNQPIEVLAATVSEFVTNPTSKVIPVCADTANTGAGEFIDSTLTDDGVSLRTVYTASPGVLEEQGFKLDYVGQKYNFGDFDQVYNGTNIAINDSAGTFKVLSQFNTSTALFGVDFDNEWLDLGDEFTEATAGAAAAKFIKVRIGSTTYKLQLYNNA